MMRRLVVAGFVLALVGTACGSHGTEARAGGEASVVAAFYPVAAAVERVGGRCVTVKNLTPAGAEPHDLELTPDDVDAIQDAKVVFVLGRGFQPAVEKSAGQRDGPTVALLDEINRGSPKGASARDPHVWLDPVRYSELVDVVRRELGRAVPKCRTTFARNAAAYRAQIADVDRDYAAGLRRCDRRTIVTAHEAFGHLAKRYALNQVGIAGIAPDTEPDARRMADVADLVQREHITTVFTEELVSPRVASALAREAGGVRAETLSPLEGLTDAQIERGDDWASVMRSNLRKLRAALGCTSG